MACDECRDLLAHEFRSPDDLIHAVRTAAELVDRGVLARIDVEVREPAEQEAMDSVIGSGHLPGALHYRFRCTVCGDRFTLHAETATGAGGWVRD